MALLEVHYPTRMPTTTATSTAWQSTLQAVGDYVAIVRQAEEPAVINAVHGYLDYFSTGSGDIVRVGIQSVNASGEPSGTWLAFADKTCTTANFPYFSFFSHTLSSTTTLTRGQLYAVVIQALSGTWNGSLYFRTNDNYYVDTEGRQAFPYMVQKIAGSVSKSNASGCFIHSCSSSTRMYGQPHKPNQLTSLSNTSSPDEIGNYIRIPTGVGSAYSILGVRLFIAMTNSAGTFDITLYNSSNTVLQQASFTCSQVVGGTTSLLQRDFYFDEASLTALVPGTYYRLAVKATNATGIGVMAYIDMPTTLGMTAYTGADGTCVYTSRAGGGAWTDTGGRMLCMKAIISDVTGSAGASGGGPLVGGRLIN
jgi:hypothetical protein